MGRAGWSWSGKGPEDHKRAHESASAPGLARGRRSQRLSSSLRILPSVTLLGSVHLTLLYRLPGPPLRCGRKGTICPRRWGTGIPVLCPGVGGAQAARQAHVRQRGQMPAHPRAPAAPGAPSRTGSGLPLETLRRGRLRPAGRGCDQAADTSLRSGPPGGITSCAAHSLEKTHFSLEGALPHLRVRAERP